MIHCVRTPQSILDEDDRDVFEEIIPTASYHQAMREALWARFRYRGIGSCDVDYWVTCMHDRYTQIFEKYSSKFSAWTQWLQELREDGIEWTSGGDTVIISQDTTSETTTTGEDFPDTRVPSENPEFISDRTRQDGSGTLDNTTTRSYRDGMQPEQVARWMDAIPNPSEDFAREFDDYFHWAI